MKALLTSLFLLLSTLPPHAKQTETSCIDSLQARMQHYMEAQAWDSAAWYGDHFLEAAYQKEDWYGSVIDAHMALGLIYAHLGNYTTAMSNLGQAHQNGMGGQREESTEQRTKEYINDLRINEAIRLLDDPTNMRALRLICQDLGFNSQTTFNTQFQSRTGMTPAQYRKKVQELNS